MPPDRSKSGRLTLEPVTVHGMGNKPRKGPGSFLSSENFYNITRNFSFIGIMALGQTVVIATGGIDLSVGSIMGLTAVCCGLTLEAGYPWWAAVIVGLFSGFFAGLVNGVVVVENAQHTGATPGMVLRRAADGSVG